MFVIGRAVHEQIQIGNSVTIKVLRIGDKHVTLGIDAPKVMPLSREDTAAVAPAPVRASASPCDLSVLIVDDTPIHTWLIQKAFSAYGADRLRVARTGKEALSLLGCGDPPGEPGCPVDLVLLESRLPDMPGVELVKRIRSSPAGRVVPIVVMSYNDSDTEVLQFLQAGANAFVPKPETQEGFRQTVLRIADFWSHARRVAATNEEARHQESLVC